MIDISSDYIQISVYIVYGLYRREVLAPSIVLHLSREFLFIYEFLLLLTIQSMPTLRNPLIIIAETRREGEGVAWVTSPGICGRTL